MKAKAVHYPEDQDAPLDVYEDAELLVQRDDTIVRIDVGDPTETDERPFGNPGLALELNYADAQTLAYELLRCAGQAEMAERARRVAHA
jgi:hypothetical protein